jgi:succinyl-diaminopimelate desuccinylase
MLHEKYNAKDNLFNTDTSTFEMTKHEKNVDSVNIIPGKEVFYIDCRLLPNYRLDDVISDLKQLAKADRFKNVKIDIEIFNRNDPAPITEKDSKIVKTLSKKINEVLNVEPKTIGIGGGTCAAFFREKNMKTVVWSKQVGTEHQPNEYTNVSDIISNIEVFLSVYYAL